MNQSSKIFISYRRADSMESTGRIFDRLKDFLGEDCVFRDIDSIPIGLPFAEVLSKTLENTDIVLVIIGPTWLSQVESDGSRRLFQEGDFVRKEVAFALESNIPVVPVLVSNAQFPQKSDLPTCISPLVERQHFQVRPDPDFHRDVDSLCLKIQEILKIDSKPIRKSIALEKKVDSLQRKNLLLKAQVDLQNRLHDIDRNWHLERERHLIKYGKGDVPQTPTFGGTFGVTFGGALTSTLITYAALNLGGPPLPFAYIWIAICVLTTIYLVYRLNSYESAKKRYQRRREDAMSDFNRKTKDLR